MERQQDIEEQMRSLSQDISRQFEDMQLEGMTDSYERGLKQIQVATERRVQEIRQQFEKLIDENMLDPQAVQRYTEELIRLEEQVRKLGEAEQERFKKNNPRTFAEGWKKAMDEYVDAITNAAKRGEQAFGIVMGNMERAIDDFVQTGKFNFKDFARSIILELIAIEMKAAASKFLKEIFSSASGTGLGKLLGFANGGTPPLNRPSIVGEKGPELFIPRAAGTVVPGKEVNMGGSGNGQVTNITNNYNISAVDARSVQQLFSENRRFLLGTVEAARRELPGGR
jgi:phage-related minor tail protein